MHSTSERPADAGVSLVEVIVAMLVFSLVVGGIVTSLTTVNRMSADNRMRVTATNLASQSLDRVRAIGNPYDVDIAALPASQDVAGRTFTFAWTSDWVSASDGNVGCGSAAALPYRRVGVRVSWNGMAATTQPVRSDTTMAPAGPVVDPETGTIGVYVKDRTGAGVPGVTVSITAVSGGGALTAAPPTTGDAGCSFSTGVRPGVYRVVLGKSGHVSSLNGSAEQNMVVAPQNSSVTVVAGQASSVSFEYDASASFTSALSANYAGTAKTPTNWTTTYLADTAGSAVDPARLFPYTNGWTPVVGAPAACAAVDPVRWPAMTVSGSVLKAGVRSETRAPAPGGSTTFSVKNGVVLVKGSSALFVTATAQNVTTNGNPGCATPPTFTFSQTTLSSSGAALALPFGSWRIFTSTTAGGPTTAVACTNLVAATNVVAQCASNVLTLDPRTL